MRSAISYGKKWLEQGANRDVAVCLLPPLSHDLAIFIQQDIGQIRIVKITFKCRRGGLSMKILGRRSRRGRRLYRYQHQNGGCNELLFYQGIQR